MGTPQLVSVDSDTLLLPSSVLAALDVYNSQKVYVAYGINAAANIVRDTGTSTSVVAIGRNAMGAMTAAKLGIAIGRNAQGNGTTTRDNIAVGDESLRNVNSGSVDYNQADLSGTRNIGIGGNAGYFITSGFLHTSIGRNAGSCLVAGQGATAIGGNALGGYAPIGFSGDIENWAPWGTGTDRIYTTAVGTNALQQNTASNNTAVGGDALKANKKSDLNTALGAQALMSIDSSTGYRGGTYSTLNITGTYTWGGTSLAVTITGHGLSVGDTAYLKLLSGGGQTFQGDVAPAVVASVSGDTFNMTVPKSLSATGNAQLVAKETAAQASLSNSNTAVGATAGAAMTTAGNVTLVGKGAGSAATTMSQVTSIGSTSLQFATSATNSVAVGFWAAGSMTGDASQVTAIGASALRNKVDGTALTEAFSNITGLGYDTRVSGSNQLQLGNTSQTVYAQAAVQTRSDERDKAEIRDTMLGLDFIEALRPVDFKWDRREDYTEYDDDGNGIGLGERDGSKRGKRFHHGFIAQEVGEVIAKLGVDFGGYQDHTVNGGDDVRSIGYEEVIAPLVKAVQQLAARVAELERDQRP